MSSPVVSYVNSDNDGSFVVVQKEIKNAQEEEFQSKVKDLMEENEELKTILRNNNDVLQRYFEELEEIKEKQHERMNRFVVGHNQARNLVRKLRDKISNLKNELCIARGKVSDLETQLALKDASFDTCDGNETLKEDYKRAQAENCNLKAENTTLIHNINLLQEQIKFLKATLEENSGIDANSEAWKVLESLSILSEDVSSSVGLKPQEPLSIGSLKDQCRKSAIDKEILKVDYDKLQIEKAQVDEQLNLMHLENEKLVKSHHHLKEEKEELCRMLTEAQANRAAENEEKLNTVVAANTELQQNVDSLVQQLQAEKEKVLEVSRRNQEFAKQAEEYEARLIQIENDYDHSKAELMKAEHEVKECEEKIREQERELEQGKKAAEVAFKIDDDDNIVREKIDALKKQLWQYQNNESKLRDKEEELAVKERGMKKVSENYESKLRHKEEELAVKEREMKKVYEENTQLHLRVQEFERVVTDLENYNVEVQSQLGGTQQLVKDNETLQGQVVQLIEENRGYEQRCGKLEEQRHEHRKQSDGLIESLRAHLASTETELKKVKEQRDTHRKEHEEVLAQNEQLMTEYDDLLKSFKSTIEGNKKKQDSSQTEVAGYKARLENLNVELGKAQQAAQKKHEDCGALERQLQETQEKVEALPLLQQQIEVYQNDFNAERQAREQQHNEILTLRHEVTQLRTENQRLQDELDNYNNSQVAEMQRRHGNQEYVTMEAVRGNLSPTSAAAQGGEVRNLIDTPAGGLGMTFLRRGSAPGNTDDQHLQPPLPQPAMGTQGAQNAGYVQDEGWTCPTCRQDFPDFQTLQMHAVECNTIPPETPRPPPPASNQPQCPKCQQFFPDIDTLQIHIEDCIF